jgi:hypothetical protein
MIAVDEAPANRPKHGERVDIGFGRITDFGGIFDRFGIRTANDLERAGAWHANRLIVLK